MIYIYVGIAGVLGALCRYTIGLAVEPFVSAALFPAATLFCNYSGSFALGWLSGRDGSFAADGRWRQGACICAGQFVGRSCARMDWQ
ncbi:MAG: hypothetical protein K0R28_6784 [Paenibacillus sp.]|nr:hypothetical protein [Paenibacillus sp.]